MRVFSLTGEDRSYFWSCVSATHSPSNPFCWFLPQPWTVTSHACSDYYSAEFSSITLCRSLNFCSVILFSLVLCLPQSSRTLSSVFSMQNMGSTLAPIPCTEARNPHVAGSWVNYRAYLVCFPSIRDDCPLLPDAQCFEKPSFHLFCLFFVCFRWEDKPGSFILPLEVEFLILYNFDCSISISISSVWGSVLERSLTELFQRLQILLGAPRSHPLLYWTVYSGWTGQPLPLSVWPHFPVNICWILWVSSPLRFDWFSLLSLA